MKLRESRMSSYVVRGQKLMAEGKNRESMKLIEKGMQYYSERVINSISPYAAPDAGMIVLVLRHLADEVEKGNQGAKELAEGLKKCMVMPELAEIEKIKKANRR